MTIKRITSPRKEYQLEENQRVEISPSLVEKFPGLKSLEVDLDYFDSDRMERANHIKYTVSLEHAKSVFRIGCSNSECVRGDFDLSNVLAEAVTAQQESVSGELCCQGWRSRRTIDTALCGKILRYKFTLGY